MRDDSGDDHLRAIYGKMPHACLVEQYEKDKAWLFGLSAAQCERYKRDVAEGSTTLDTLYYVAINDRFCIISGIISDRERMDALETPQSRIKKLTLEAR